MKLKLSLITFSLLLLSQIGISQSSPGYLGKKNTLGVGYGFIYAYNGPDAKNRGSYSRDFDKQDKIARDKLFNIEYTRTLTRRGSVSLLYTKSSTGENAYFFAPLKPELGFPSNSGIRVEGFFKVDISSFAIMYNFFKTRKGYIAPFGASFSIGLKRNTIKPSTELPGEVSSAVSFENFDLDPVFSVNSIVLGWSNTIIIEDIIYIKPRLLFAGSFKSLADLNEPGTQDDFEYDFIDKLVKHEIIQFDISAGLIF